MTASSHDCALSLSLPPFLSLSPSPSPSSNLSLLWSSGENEVFVQHTTTTTELDCTPPEQL